MQFCGIAYSEFLLGLRFGWSCENNRVNSYTGFCRSQTDFFWNDHTNL